MSRIYAIGDVHGQLSQLERAMDWVEKDQAREGGPIAPVVFVGDLTDRGPDSQGVISWILEALDQGRDWTVIKGNHDRMFTGFCRSADHKDPILRDGLTWLSPGLGGMTTLASYGVKRGLIEGKRSLHRRLVTAVPDRHIEFLESLPLTHEVEELLFVHAGLKPGVALQEQTEDDLLWIRSGWLEDTRDHGPLVVHGHTAIAAPEHYGNRVNIDGGAAYGRDLVPVVFEGRDCWTLSASGRTPLLPIGT